MDTVHNPAPDNTRGQLGPRDIRRTRTLDNSAGAKPTAGKPVVASFLGNVPSFPDTQQKWEDPAPYGGNSQREGKIGSTRRELDAWIQTLSQPRMMAMEATIFTGWIYWKRV